MILLFNNLNQLYLILKEIMRENWLFKLVGKEYFTINKHKCAISIDAVNGFAYEYSLEVDGKSYEKFCENQTKILQSWTFRVKDEDIRIVLEKNTMDIWVNGDKLDVEVRLVEFKKKKMIRSPILSKLQF
jgi:hypothetical protein